jgi:acyl transferase domain-containing protein
MFPGSGHGPSPGELRGLAESNRYFMELVEQCDQVALEFQRPVISGWALGSKEQRNDDLRPEDHHVVQLAAAVALFQTASRDGKEPKALVGHSLGELWALTCAGAVSVQDAARLVYLRGEAMRTGARSGDMAAVGAAEPRVQHLVGLVDEPWMAVACINSPRQCVLSGDTDTLRVAGRIAEFLGWPFHLLDVGYPYHSPGMAAAASKFRNAAAQFTFEPLGLPVFSSILGRHFQHTDDVADALGRALVRPVRFLEAVEVLHAAGVGEFIECGFGGVLTRCVQASVPDIVAVDARRLLAGEGVGTVAEPAARPTESDGIALNGHPVESREVMLTRLQQLYADHLGYPVEEMSETADLEAELGVDSLKQTELLTLVDRRFGIDRFEGRVRLLDYPTLGDVADVVWQHSSR